MTRGIRSYGPGKFNTILDSYAYEAGVDEETSYEEGGGWYGLSWINDATIETVRDVAAEANDDLTAQEEELLGRREVLGEEDEDDEDDEEEYD